MNAWLRLDMNRRRVAAGQRQLMVFGKKVWAECCEEGGEGAVKKVETRRGHLRPACAKNIWWDLHTPSTPSSSSLVSSSCDLQLTTGGQGTPLTWLSDLCYETLEGKTVRHCTEEEMVGWVARSDVCGAGAGKKPCLGGDTRCLGGDTREHRENPRHLQYIQTKWVGQIWKFVEQTRNLPPRSGPGSIHPPWPWSQPMIWTDQ